VVADVSILAPLVDRHSVHRHSMSLLTLHPNRRLEDYVPGSTGKVAGLPVRATRVEVAASIDTPERQNHKEQIESYLPEA
jgi:hypothetical protein